MSSRNVTITVARKPLMGGTLAKNAMKHGTGGLNIDGCRVGYGANEPDSGANFYRHRNQSMPENRTNYFGGTDGVCKSTPSSTGRWPANLILASPEAIEALDEQSGVLTSGKEPKGGFYRNTDKQRSVFGAFAGQDKEPSSLYGDTGGASRFFKQVAVPEDA